MPRVPGAKSSGASLPQVSGAVASGASLPQVSGAASSGTSLSQSSGAVVSGASLPQLPNAMPTDVAVSPTVGGPAAEPLTDPFELNLPDLFGGEEPLEAGDSLVHSGPPIDEPDVVASPVAVSPQEEQASSESNVKWDQQWRDQPLGSVPMVEIPFFVALPSKHAAAATEAVMQVVTALQALGLPVARLHSDRGGEFVNRSLRLFCLQHCIERTTTAGDNALDFRQNGRCENMVRRLKRQARTLLQAYQAPVELWAFAMRHSAARLRAYALSLLGLPQPALLPWYTQVVLRTRTWNSDQWSSRALKGRVIAPSGDVHHGHLVLCSDGQFLHSDSLVEWVHTGPHPMHVAEHLLPPTRRYRRKTPPDLSVAAPEHARQGGAGEVSAASAAGVSKFASLGKQKTVRFEVPEGEGLGEFTPYRSDPSGPRSQDEVRANLLLQQVGPIERDQVRSLVDGIALPAFHRWDQCMILGCKSGLEAALTPETRQRPALAKLLCRFFREQCPSGRFSAIAVRRIRVHTASRRDELCMPGTLHTVIPVGKFKGGGMWIEGSRDLEGTSFRWEPSLRELRSGSTHSAFPYLCFDPSRCHEVQETQGDRLILLGFVPVCTPGLSDEDLQWLVSHGFSLQTLTGPL